MRQLQRQAAAAAGRWAHMQRMQAPTLSSATSFCSGACAATVTAFLMATAVSCQRPRHTCSTHRERCWASVPVPPPCSDGASPATMAPRTCTPSPSCSSVVHSRSSHEMAVLRLMLLASGPAAGAPAAAAPAASPAAVPAATPAAAAPSSSTPAGRLLAAASLPPPAFPVAESAPAASLAAGGSCCSAPTAGPTSGSCCEENGWLDAVVATLVRAEGSEDGF